MNKPHRFFMTENNGLVNVKFHIKENDFPLQDVILKAKIRIFAPELAAFLFSNVALR